MKKLKDLLIYFLTFFKIGLFTFGGGYAMVSVIENNIVEKNRWISQEEFLDLIAVAESTPGPIAVNSATYIGYKLSGFLGSLFCTLGVVLPSFIIIFIISFFYKQFLSLEYVGYAFKGIQVCVAFLIFFTGIKMLIKAKKSLFTFIVFFIVLVLMIVLDLFSKNISAIIYILCGGVVGLFLFLIGKIHNKKKSDSVKGEK